MCPWTETVLHRFGASGDGLNPNYGDLVFDRAGNIYGTTFGGGAFGTGTVYELVHSSGGWTEQVLYSFANQADGGIPSGGLILDQSGNLYGTTAFGGRGNPGNGVIFELTPSGSGWEESVLYAFRDLGDGATPEAALTISDTGSFVGTTIAGGSGTCANGPGEPTGCGVVFTGFGTTIYSFTAFTSLAGPVAPVTLDSVGNLYGTTRRGGPLTTGSVFRLASGTYTYSSLHDFTGQSDGGGPVSNVVVDSNGNLYGTASYGGMPSPWCGGGCGVVWEITQ